jgi:hypothetical protein
MAWLIGQKYRWSMKTCKYANKCCYGNIYKVNECAYKNDMKEDDPCPNMIEEWEDIIDELEKIDWKNVIDKLEKIENE